MLRAVLVLALVLLALSVLRLARLFVTRLFAGSPPRAGVSSRERGAVMVRDPICGTWIDRQLAVTVRRGSDAIPVCSEKCRRLLEAAG